MIIVGDGRMSLKPFSMSRREFEQVDVLCTGADVNGKDAHDLSELQVVKK